MTQKIFKSLLLLSMLPLIITSAAFAAWEAQFSWQANPDPAVSGYEILMDGSVVVPGLAKTATAASFTFPEISGQSFTLRTLGLGGEYVDSEPVIAVKAPATTSGFSIKFVYKP